VANNLKVWLNRYCFAGWAVAAGFERQYSSKEFGNVAFIPCNLLEIQAAPDFYAGKALGVFLLLFFCFCKLQAI
jgi:hypothetical protein